MHRAAIMAAAALWLTACTLEAGHGFATLRSAELEVGLERGSTRIDGDTVLTSSGQRVRLDRFTIDVSHIELQQLEGSVGTGVDTFDPADPPPGYTLCHGGHCHSEEGELVSYEEIQAMLGGGSVTWAPLVTIPVDRQMDALGRERASLRSYQPSAELPRGVIGRILVAIERVRLTGAVIGAVGEEERPLHIDVPVEGAGFVATVNRPLDRDHEADVALEVEVPIGGRLFDETDLSAEPVDPAPLLLDLLGTDIRVAL